MKKYLLLLTFTCGLLSIANNVRAQAPGSSEATGGTAGTSAMALEASDVTASVAETLYIGPGDYTINGTWEIYSKNVWISPAATFTGTARGHPVAGGTFCAEVLPADEQVDHEHPKENHGCADGVGVAGECARVGEFYRAVGDSDARFGAGGAAK